MGIATSLFELIPWFEEDSRHAISNRDAEEFHARRASPARGGIA
jgi:hypothetical protein